MIRHGRQPRPRPHGPHDRQRRGRGRRPPRRRRRCATPQRRRLATGVTTPEEVGRIVRGTESRVLWCSQFGGERRVLASKDRHRLVGDSGSRGAGTGSGTDDVVVNRLRGWLVSRIAGSATRAAPGQQQPIPAKTDQPNGLTHGRANPHGYWLRTAEMAQQPNPTLVDKIGSCPKTWSG